MKKSWLALLCLALVTCLLYPPPLTAQEEEDEEDAVRAVVDRLFEAMRAGDSAAARGVFHPAARLVTAGVREGEPFLDGGPIDGFVQAVGHSHDRVWDERLDEVEIRIDGPLAVVWAEYEFWLDDEFSHCGVDAFLLFRGEEGWRIFEIADTRRREGCDAMD